MAHRVDPPERQKQISRQRWEILHKLENWLEGPVIILGFLWLVLLVVELVWGLHPLLNGLVYIIWGIFVLDFLVRLVLAPQKRLFLRRNWLTALSLLLPALRIARIVQLLRLARAARALRAIQGTRGLRIVSLVGSINRGMRSLRRAMRRRGFGYVLLLTLFVTFVGAAGMFTFERGQPGEYGLETYGEALWWTSMIMTTLGSEYWPQTVEGRFLALLLSLYAFAVFGYVTASLATFFIGQEVSGQSQTEGIAITGEIQPDDLLENRTLATAQQIQLLSQQVAALHRDLRESRAELEALRAQIRSSFRDEAG